VERIADNEQEMRLHCESMSSSYHSRRQAEERGRHDAAAAATVHAAAAAVVRMPGWGRANSACRGKILGKKLLQKLPVTNRWR